MNKYIYTQLNFLRFQKYLSANDADWNCIEMHNFIVVMRH